MSIPSEVSIDGSFLTIWIQEKLYPVRFRER